jgi:hypothetical protein
MQLRYFAALHDIAGDRSSTVVFPLPIDLLAHIAPAQAAAANTPAGESAPEPASPAGVPRRVG